MSPEHIKANLEQWLSDQAFHTIAGACGDLIREVERLRGILEKVPAQSCQPGDGWKGCLRALQIGLD